MKKIAISPGDPAGIGPDICIKAFEKIKNNDFLPIFFGDPDFFKERAKLLRINLNIREYSQKDSYASSEYFLVKPYSLDKEVVAGKPDPYFANYLLTILKETIKLNLSGEFSALVTGPLNKKLINKGGIKFKGHTETLAEESNTDKVVMMLTNNSLKIALATTHEPLRAVPSLITEKHLSACIRIINNDLKDKWGIERPLIRVLGLNPHAGDGGFIGKEDKEIIFPALQKLKEEGINVEGPVSADTAYINQSEAYDVILAMYHDQGLPVIKTTGFGKSVNITLGLPFIRTSVDHGTAYDKAGTNEADDSSFKAAYNLASFLALKN